MILPNVIIYNKIRIWETCGDHWGYPQDSLDFDKTSDDFFHLISFVQILLVQVNYPTMCVRTFLLSMAMVHFPY